MCNEGEQTSLQVPLPIDFTKAGCPSLTMAIGFAFSSAFSLSGAVPLYEAYPLALLGMLDMPTLQQRVGNRSWNGAADGADSDGLWTLIWLLLDADWRL